MVRHVTHSALDTQALAIEFGRALSPNSVVCFFGELGAGKTTFIKGLAEGLSAGLETQVSSPTFTYLNIYRGVSTLYHFDLYRLRDADEFLGMGFDEMFYAEGICCIEWSEKIASLLPPGTICVRMAHLDESSRQIDITLAENNG
ncbi:MAG: tRNA (adenosine(37)-N6)-threonylcarbamoyltransferase complex ATPase subunit type 1 TsaE [Parachlamydiaceae bacterium]|nr:tRNA (adenosine(37)-N6)-threonylcarbamoyltransferase complex ATPase subunit type 1 TsaE [Parachlamydiaceae bacterium]